MMPSQKPELRTQDTDQDEIDLARVVTTLWQGKWVIAASSLVCAGFAGVYLWLAAPTYEANALLQIQEGQSTLALPSSVGELLGDEGASTLAELEIIRSRQVLGNAVAALKLDWQANPTTAPVIGHALKTRDIPLPDTGLLSCYARPGDGITLAYLEVPPHWLNLPLTVEKTGQDRYRVTLPDETRLEGKVGELVSDKARGVAIQISVLTGAVGRCYDVVHLSELEAISRLSERLSVAERGRQTGIVEVKLRGGDPAATERRLNAVIRAYAEQNVTQSAAEARKSLEFVESQLPVAQAAVEAAERALNDYRAAQKSVDLEFETQSLLTEATGVEAQLRDLALQEEELKEKYTPNHPVYRQLLDQRAALTARLAELQAGITALPETQREVVNLTRKLEVAQASYLGLMNRSQELRVLSASQIGSVRIIDTAATQPDPVAPRRLQVAILALVAGVLCGIGLVLLRDWMRRGIDTVAEIERLGLPVFATVNNYTGPVKPTGGWLPLVAREDPDDLVVEALRSLRTSLHFGMLDVRSKSIVVTSAAPGAGKSFLCANLACVAAQAGQKICVIDADMRRGTQRKYFGLPKKTPGLADYLSDEAELDDVLRESGIPNLSLVVTGQFPPNPSELLMRERFGELVAALDGRFDLILIDAPPVLAVTDAAILGRKAGSVIAVARHLVTPADELDAVRKSLETAGVPLKGVVFNGFDPRRSKGGRRGYGYGYGYSNRYTYKRI